MNIVPHSGERGVADVVRSNRLALAGPQPQSPGSLFDVYKLLAILRRRLKLIAGVFVAVFLAVVLPTLVETPMYKATALVVLDQRQPQVTTGEAVLQELPRDSNTVDTEVEVIKSQQLAEQVMDKLRLDADPEFGGDPAAAAAADRVPPGAPLSLEEQERRASIASAIEGKLQAQRVGLTYVISIAFQSENPVKAARIADAFANQYIAQQLDTKFDARRQANTWLGGKLQQLQGDLQRAETAVEQYKIANNLMSSSGETLTEQEISAFNQQMATARSQQAEAEARLNAARSQISAGGGALDSEVIRSLRSKRAEISARAADYSVRFGPKYPDLIAANKQLDDIDAQIAAETKRVLSELEAQAAVSRQRTGSIQGSLSGARGTLASNTRAGVHLRDLEREAESVRTLYESMLNRYKETSTEAGIEQSDARLASGATVPTSPSSPNIPLRIALGLIAAAGAALLAVAIAELADTSFGTGEDIERRLGFAHLGSIPDLTSMGTTEQPHIYITSRPMSAFAESFRSLRTALLQGSGPRPPKVVAITSALPGEGKTIASVCLAKSAAQAGDKVAVIDCDLRRRRLSTSLGIKPQIGLLDVLAGNATLESALVYDSPTGVAILPLTPEKITTEDVFGSAAMKQLLDDLSERFDLVVLDTAPVLALAETRTLVAQVDAIVLLARWRRTPQKAVEHAIRLLRGSESKIAGIMLSQVDMSQQKRQGYGDAAYYADAYEKYYVG